MAWQVNLGKIAKENADEAKREAANAREAAADTKAAILEANNKVDEVEALRVATNDVKEQTEVVRDNTEIERTATELVRGDTIEVKEATEAVRAATEIVRQNTESERVNTANERMATVEEREAMATERAATKVVKDATETERQALASYKNGIDSRMLTVEEKATIAETLSKEAKARADLIIGQTGSANTEIVDSRLGADLVARATAGGLIREIHANQLESARQTTTLNNGVSVISGGVDALAETEIEGRTLISLANSNLEATKQYVVANKNTKLIVDGITQAGVAKFTKGTTTVSTANFVGKTNGSIVANPHVMKYVSSSQTSGIISQPNNVNAIEESTAQMDKIKSLDGTSLNQSRTQNGQQAQQLFSFDIIAEIERKLGIIPKSTLAEKVQWVKDNGENLTANWHGFGSSPLGNKATLRIFDVVTGAWGAYAGINHTSASVTKLAYPIATPNIGTYIDTNGFVHYLAYADASDGITASSISTDFIDLVVTLKATAQLNTRPTIIRVENFEGKVAGSVVENPHVIKATGGNTAVTTLQIPSSVSLVEVANASYGNMATLNGVTSNPFGSTSVSGASAQTLFSFNLIEAIERNIGKIPRTSVADKVQWVKDNVNKVQAYWYGFGSSVGGNKAYFQRHITSSNTWFGSSMHTSPTVTTLSTGSSGGIDNLDANGFSHYLAFSDASDGIIPSTINTDYILCEIELKPTADFTRPKVALYEVTADSYAKILVDWNADEVVNRYPIVEGVQHLQGVGVVAEGENLLPPFTEWVLHANAKVLSPYEAELNATANFQSSSFAVNTIVGQTYAISYNLNGGASYLRISDDIGDIKADYILGYRVNTFVARKNVTVIAFLNRDLTKTTFSQPMLNLGNVAKPFVPRNPSYLYADVKLGAIGTVYDRLYEQDGSKFVRKVVEKDVVLGGDLAWFIHQSATGYKVVKAQPFVNAVTFSKTTSSLLKFDGKALNSGIDTMSLTGADYYRQSTGDPNFFVNVQHTDTGFGETYVPLTNEVKAYFYGWKINNGTFGTNYEATGTKTWIPISDTSNARAVTVVPTSASPTQLDGTIQPYKLSYALATPQVINVTDKVEGSLKVNGLTQVEVLSGIVRREKVVPVLSGGNYLLNDKTKPLSSLKRTPLKILSMYVNGQKDNKWIIGTSVAYNNNVQMYIPQADYDPTAEYTVTYIALDKPLLTANPTNIKLLYANNMRSSLEDAVGKVQDNTTQLSVHEKAIIDLFVRVKALGG